MASGYGACTCWGPEGRADTSHEPGTRSFVKTWRNYVLTTPLSAQIAEWLEQSCSCAGGTPPAAQGIVVPPLGLWCSRARIVVCACAGGCGGLRGDCAAWAGLDEEEGEERKTAFSLQQLAGLGGREGGRDGGSEGVAAGVVLVVTVLWPRPQRLALPTRGPLVLPRRLCDRRRTVCSSVAIHAALLRDVCPISTQTSSSEGGEGGAARSKGAGSCWADLAPSLLGNGIRTLQSGDGRGLEENCTVVPPLLVTRIQEETELSHVILPSKVAVLRSGAPSPPGSTATGP
jgi:hypothetical protein